MPIHFTDRFRLTPVAAGYCTAACVFAGSLLRPMASALADRIGGVKALSFVFPVAAIAFAFVGLAPAIGTALGLFVLPMLALGNGNGNGAVFQLVPQRFATEIGVMTGTGGFHLASSLGLAGQWSGSFAPGFLIFAADAGIPDLIRDREPRALRSETPDPGSSPG